jgi:hypothetical protein
VLPTLRYVHIVVFQALLTIKQQAGFEKATFVILFLTFFPFSFYRSLETHLDALDAETKLSKELMGDSSSHLTLVSPQKQVNNYCRK